MHGTPWLVVGLAGVVGCAEATRPDGGSPADAGEAGRDAGQPDLGPLDEDAGAAASCDPGCVAAIEAELVRVPAGELRVGAPKAEPGFDGIEYPPHRVTISRDFWIGRTEVTQAQYLAVRGRNPSHWADCGPSCPVDQVSWYNAVYFVNELSRRAGLPVCYEGEGVELRFVGLECAGYRLPTEAEWEYAARAGSTTALPTGDPTQFGCEVADPLADGLGWYCANSGLGPHPVAGKAPNAFGLYDMAGNVWEWVHDVYAAYPNAVLTDPLGPAEGPTRVRRGGSYRDGTGAVRSASRSRDPPDGRHYCIGFRIARTSTST